MSYDQQQQGFNHNPGGVPHGGVPTFPNVAVGDVMQPYLPMLAAKVYTDMAQRGTAYTNYMAGLYSANGYHNPLFEEIIVMAANYAEYSMVTYNKPFNEIVDSVVSDCNSVLLENHVRTNPQKIPVNVTDIEMRRYRAAKTKIDSLRMKLSAFLKHKETHMQPNQYPQPPFPAQQAYQQPPMSPPYHQNAPQQFQQPPYPQQGYPQQGYAQPPNPAQIAWQQQQQAQAQQYQQQMMMQQRQQYNGGRPPQQGNAFTQRVDNRMMAPQPQGFGHPPQYQQPYQQGYNQPNWQQPNHQQQLQQQQYQQQMAYNNQYYNQPPQQNPGQFGFNPAQAPQQHHQHQASPRMLSTSNYDPMPMVDEAKLAERRNEDPFAANAAIIHQQTSRPQPAGNPGQSSFTQGASYSQPTKPNPPTSTTAEERKYERRVRAHADTLGLPEEASLSYLEAAITERDPNNGFISPKNAYSEVKGATMPTPVTGAYGSAPQNVLDDEMIERFAIPGEPSGDNFATQIMKQAADQSKGRLVKEANSNRYTWMSYADIQAFETAHPGVSIDGADIARFKSKPPYDFAIMNMVGDWTVEAKHYSKIKSKGWFTKPVLYPVYSSVGYYVVNDKGTIQSFYSRPKTDKEKNVDYDAHDDRRFFTPMSPKDLAQDGNDARMLQTFANLQVTQKVAEVIKDIETQAGVIDGDSEALIINKTIELEEQIDGGLVGDDYYLEAKRAMSDAMGDINFDTADVSYRFKHVHMYPWTITDNADIALVRKLRHKTDYLEIGKILIEFSEAKDFPGSWFERINDVATRYVNDVILTYFPLGAKERFRIKSFALDIKSAVDEMETLGYGEAFNATAARLTNTLAYVWDNTNPVFADYYPHLNEGNSDDESHSKISTTGFGIVRDITVIPLHSRDVPLYTDEDKCLLTEDGFNSLWLVAKDRIENRDLRVTETIIVTSDNRQMYISETAVEGIYAVTKKSIMS